AAGDDVGFAQIRDGDEVLALELVDQRVVAVEARRGTLQTLAAEPEVLGERRVLDDRRPARRASGDRAPDGVERVALRVPGAAGKEDGSGLEVEVVAGGVDVAGALVAELDARVRLVGRLVLGEADVAVDPEE